MAITPDEVRRIAKLANLDVPDDDCARFAQQLTAILGYVAQLDRLDTSAIEPTSHVEEGADVLREDAVRPSIDRDEALANAPAHERGAFKVPRVLG